MPTTRLKNIWKGLALLGGLGVLLCAAGGWIVARHLPRPPTSPEGPQQVNLSWPDARPPDPAIWTSFQPDPASAPSRRAAGPLASRFRLAGTFFLTGGGTGDTNVVRKAIIDDLSAAQQLLLAEGDRSGEVLVRRVAEDHVVLREGALEETIWLTFLQQGGGERVASPTDAAPDGEPIPEVALETTRFGKRVGLNRWVIEREELVKYYQEILDDPERVAALYVSLKPDYHEKDIKGYILDVAGEADFFRAVGLNQGDTIRKVNSMNMTSQKRAEYFISEFMKNRVNAFVIDIEREGKPEKMIYLLR